MSPQWRATARKSRFPQAGAMDPQTAAARFGDRRETGLAKITDGYFPAMVPKKAVAAERTFDRRLVLTAALAGFATSACGALQRG
ncbi:hypothetical protein ABT262_45135, partial [Amycolatopsis mediterranei]